MSDFVTQKDLDSKTLETMAINEQMVETKAQVVTSITPAPAEKMTLDAVREKLAAQTGRRSMNWLLPRSSTSSCRRSSPARRCRASGLMQFRGAAS